MKNTYLVCGKWVIYLQMKIRIRKELFIAIRNSTIYSFFYELEKEKVSLQFDQPAGINPRSGELKSFYNKYICPHNFFNSQKMKKKNQKFPALLLSLLKSPIYIGLCIYIYTSQRDSSKTEARHRREPWVMAVAAQPSLRLHHNYASFRMNQSAFRHPQLRPPHRSSRARIRASSAVALEPVRLSPHSFYCLCASLSVCLCSGWKCASRKWLIDNWFLISVY